MYAQTHYGLIGGSSVADMVQGINSSQRANARIIEREFTAAGFGPPVVAAAIINAIAESALNNAAVGDSGASVGLFQLHERGGGRGMTVQERMDPTKNTKRIIQEAFAAPSFMSLVRSGDTNVKRLAASFSTYVERPADKPGNEIRRAAMVDRYFGTSANRISGMTKRFSISGMAKRPRWLTVALVGTSLAMFGVAIYTLRKDK
jgi:hypothetical protein